MTSADAHLDLPALGLAFVARTAITSERGKVTMTANVAQAISDPDDWASAAAGGDQ